MGVATGGGGEGAGRSNPTLPPCGQLTRCFSAVAELLVFTLTATILRTDLILNEFKLRKFCLFL